MLSSDLFLQNLAADAEAKTSVIQELSSAVAKADSLVARVAELEADAVERKAELEEAQRTTRDLCREVEQAKTQRSPGRARAQRYVSPCLFFCQT